MDAHLWSSGDIRSAAQPSASAQPHGFVHVLEHTSFDNGQMTNSTQGAPFSPVPQSAFAALVSIAARQSGTCFFFDPVTFSAPTPTSCEPTTPVSPVPLSPIPSS